MITNLLKRTGALALVCLSLVTSQADAITINFSSAGNADIRFNGTGDTFTFNDSGVDLLDPNANGRDFKVGSVTGAGATGSATGLYGNIGGTYQIGAISTVGAVQTAAVTLASAPLSNMFSIFDGAVSLTAQVNWMQIKTEGTGGNLNQAGGILSLTNILYSGTNLDLLALKNLGGGIGIATVNFTFIPAMNLSALTADGVVSDTTYSGSVSANVPDGGATAVLMGMGLLGVGLLGRRMTLVKI